MARKALTRSTAAAPFHAVFTAGNPDTSRSDSCRGPSTTNAIAATATTLKIPITVNQNRSRAPESAPASMLPAAADADSRTGHAVAQLPDRLAELVLGLGADHDTALAGAPAQLGGGLPGGEQLGQGRVGALDQQGCAL